MSIRLGTSTIRRTRPRFLRTRKLDWTDGIDFFLRLSLRARGATRHEPSRKEPWKGARLHSRSYADRLWPIEEEPSGLLGYRCGIALGDPTVTDSSAAQNTDCGRDVCPRRRPY